MRKAFRFIIWLAVSILSVAITYIYFISAMFGLIDDAWYFLVISGILGSVFAMIKTSDSFDDLWKSLD